MSLFYRVLSSKTLAISILLSLCAVSIISLPVAADNGAKKVKFEQVQDKKAKPININTADAQSLSEGLTGVGITRAEAIVAYRKSNGKFKRVEQLTEVKGIGSAILEKNRSRIRI